MHDYRVYLIDKNGHIGGPPTILKCPDDQAAVEQAKQYLDGRAVEIWDGARRVAHFDPIHLPPP